MIIYLAYIRTTIPVNINPNNKLCTQQEDLMK